MNDPMQWYAQAHEAFNRCEWRQVQSLVARIAPYAPRHGGVHYLAGVAALQLQQVRLAIEHLRSAVQFDPERADYYAQYARALAMAHQLREAARVADKAMELPPTDAPSFDTLGTVYSRAHAHEKAAHAFRRAVELRPDHANYRFNLATSFMFFGDIESAEREYEACLSKDPTCWRAHLALSQLRIQTKVDNHISRLESLSSQYQKDDEAQIYLNLALAKEHEDVNDYPQAFTYFVRGKSTHRRRIAYSADQDTAVFDAVMSYCVEPVVDGSGFDTVEPIFVMGMPRSGTTLVDRIISAHSWVHSAGELSDFGIVLQRASGKAARSLDQVLAHLGPDFRHWDRLGRSYLESTRPGTGHTPRFTDKLPHNFLHAGFIARALPNAKIICVRRNPMDTCLGNFRQMFALDSPDFDYSFDLLDIGRYYLQFNRLMDHWRRVLPGRIVEIDYECLVESPEKTTRELLTVCALPWEEGVLHFEQSDAPVTTASAVQVRSPINRSSMQRWKRYEAQLTGLRRLLEDGGIAIS